MVLGLELVNSSMKLQRKGRQWSDVVLGLGLVHLIEKMYRLGIEPAGLGLVVLHRTEQYIRGSRGPRVYSTFLMSSEFEVACRGV